MAEQNNDGFAPGQAVSFAEIQKANATRGTAEEFTPESIARMKRADVVDLLDAHGISEVEGVKLPELRNKLTAIMFVGI